MASGRLRPVGDRAVLVEVADNRAAHAAAAVARRAGGSRLSDVVVGHRTALVVWDRPPVDPAVLASLNGPHASGDGVALPARTVTVPVSYDGPDLAHVAAATGLTEEEVVARHAAARYTVAFMGFAPGFAYLLGGDPRLAVARRDAPRERVPPGAVAVAGPYSAVYPSASPGGWQLLGTTALRVWDVERDPPALLVPGDAVVFEPLPA